MTQNTVCAIIGHEQAATYFQSTYLHGKLSLRVLF